MRRAVAGIVTAGVVAVGVLALLTGPPDPQDAPRPAPASRPEPAVVDLPEGSLEPIIGDPRPDDVRFCDEELWRGVAPILVEVRDGTAFVDARAWRRHPPATRGGIASWISKCHADGRPVTLVASGSGELLGRYDPAVGLRADTAEPGSR